LVKKIIIGNICRTWLSLLVIIGVLGCAHLPAVAPPATPLKPGAVIYGVVPPLFGENPLPAVTDRLDYLQDLGVDVILLSPINSSDDLSDISYAITDYFDIRPDFGTLADLKRLVREAEKRGIKVMMDFVPNHTSAAHPFFLDAREKSSSSRYYDYYDRDISGRATYYFDWSGLPNLNYDHPEVVSMMTHAFQYWILVAGIDGYRVDVAWGIRKRAPQVWGPLIRELRKADPGIVMLAEAGARDPYYVANGFDLAYDWTEKPGHWAWQPVFERTFDAGRLLHQALTENQNAPHTVLRFLNNNDTGVRFITRHGPELTRAAAVLQHTVPGIPLIFTGDEIGAQYEPYDDRPPLAWEDEHGLHPLYRRLAALREALPAIHSGNFIPLPPEEQSSAYAFLRVADDRNWALVIVNFGDSVSVTLAPPETFGELIAGSQLKNVLDGKLFSPAFDQDGRLKIALDAYAAFVLVPE
jgi:cyclomaltodextrinase / maltogenic alpha-amylase / neopullulanase